MIVNPPYSNVTVGASMQGKSHLWMTLIRSGSVFGRRPSEYFIFGNANLAQYEHLREHLPENVHIHPVRELSDHVASIPEFAFVLLDEVNNATAGASAREKRDLLELIKSLYCEVVHFKKLYLVTILQYALKSKFYQLIAVSQSVALAGYTARSVRLLRDLELDAETSARATALLRVLKSGSRPQFALVYHNPSAYHPFLHRYIWAFLDRFPHFALAVGDESTAAEALEGAGFGAVAVPREGAPVTMEEGEEAAELRQVVRAAPEALKASMFALVPLSSIRTEEAEGRRESDEAAAAAAADPDRALRAREQQSFDALDAKVTEMIHCICGPREIASFKKLWFFVRRMDAFSINPEGTILFCRPDRQVNLMTFFKECLRQPVCGGGGGGGDGQRRRRDAARLQECLPFVAAMLGDPAFPAYLVRNKRLLELAARSAGGGR